MDTPPNLQPAPVPPQSVTRRIKRIAPVKLGTMMAALYGCLGLLFMPVFLLISLISPSMPPAQRVGMMAFGIGFAVMMPLIYAAMGFIGGALGALIYNVLAKWIGGIEVEVE